MRQKDQLYEELLRFCSTPRTIKEILDEFPGNTRNDIHYRLRKDAFHRLDIGTLYRRKKVDPSIPVEGGALDKSFMFIMWTQMNEGLSFIECMRFILKLYNKKFGKNFQLEEYEDENE